MRFKVSIIIIGKICSGKSTLASDLSKWLGIPKCSFGSYLLNYAKDRNMQTDRETLQTLGESLIQKDHETFFKDVIAFGDINNEKVIFEGVRHHSILADIEASSENTLSIFLDAKEDVRLQRFVNREKDIDEGHKAIGDFYRYSAHPVEQEVEELKALCDFVITSNKGYRDSLKLLGVSQFSA